MASTDPKVPNNQELMIMYHIIKHHKGSKIETDWDLVAEDSNFKNAETAKVRWGQIKRKLGINQDTPRKPPSTPSARSPATGRGPAVPASSPSVLSATPGSVAGVRKPAAGRRPGAKKPGPKPKVKPEVHEDEDLAVGDIPQKPARQKPGPKPRQPAAQPSPRRAVTPAPAEEEDDGREDEGEGNVVRRQYLDMQQTPLPGILDDDDEEAAAARAEAERMSELFQDAYGVNYQY